ncbi:helix-turn-helix domain-containing protein [Enterococcus cecorum]|uniref:helix-turn-helix domain-containing protein n=1 Tax=Enterococcus cecorum TaxID=44008 RepID=UPI000DE84D08
MYHLFLETYEVEMTYSGFWRLLKRHGWSIQTPRPKHPKAADESVQESSKKLT